MTELEMISKLSEPEQSPTSLASIRVKTPRRILHFSDGIMEEYSSDDDVDGPNKNGKIDENGHGSGTMIDYVLKGGNKVLAACDFVGERVAAVLGITTPKYNYEFEQFKKIQKEKERAVEEEKSTGGWMQDTLSAQCKLAEKEMENNNCPIISQEGLQKY